MHEVTDPSRKADPPVSAVEVGLALIVRTPPDSGGSTAGAGGGGRHEILVTKRKPDTVYADYWEFPGGKVEPGETPEAAAVREAWEEVGLAVRAAQTLAPVVHTYEHGTVRLHPVLCVIEPDSPEPRALHVAAWRWRTLDELPGERFLPANVRIVEALRAALADAPIG